MVASHIVELWLQEHWSTEAFSYYMSKQKEIKREKVCGAEEGNRLIDFNGMPTCLGLFYGETATCLPLRKLSKLDEPDMQDTAGEAGTSS